MSGHPLVALAFQAPFEIDDIPAIAARTELEGSFEQVRTVQHVSPLGHAKSHAAGTAEVLRAIKWS